MLVFGGVKLFSRFLDQRTKGQTPQSFVDRKEASKRKKEKVLMVVAPS